MKKPEEQNSRLEPKIKLVQIIADSDLGGGPSHVLGLLRHIDKSKFRCYLICPEGDLARQARDLKGVEVSTTLMRSKFDLIALFKIRRLLSEIQAENDPFGTMIVHTHGGRAGLLGRMAAPRNAYQVYTEHRWDFDFHLESRLNEFLQLAFLKHLNFKTDLIIAVSSSVRDFLIKQNLAPKGRVKVIPNAIELKSSLKWKKIKKSGNHYTLGNVGNLNLPKGQIYLIEAMKEVVKTYPHSTLEIIGEGPERVELESKIKELSLERHVTLLGRRNDPMEHMAKWDLFVLSSIAETFGIVLLEAFAVGIPIVSTNIGGVKDVLTHRKSALLVERKSPKQLAGAIIELLSRPALAEKFSRAGKERVKRFEWNRVIQQVEKTYGEIIR